MTAQGRELTEALRRVKAGGIVFDSNPQITDRTRHNNSGKATATTHPLTENPMADESQPQQNSNSPRNGAARPERHRDDEAVSSIKQIADWVISRPAGEPVFTVNAVADKDRPLHTVRSLSEKLIDGGIVGGAVFLGMAGAAALARFAFGIGKTPTVPVTPA